MIDISPVCDSSRIWDTICLMALTDEDIQKFKGLYQTHFGKDISNEEAYEKGVKLLRLMKVIYKPMTEEQYVAIQDHCEQKILSRYEGRNALHDFLNEV